MADVITRLKVDSSEYDNKIKRASQGILQLEKTIREAGECFIQTSVKEREFAKGLGQMETVSKTARGSIGELTSAFTEMSMVYKRMTEEEKNSPFGRNLASSLDQLKTRINDTKKDLADIEKELNGATQATGDFSGMLGQLGSKLGINADLLGAVTTGTIGMTAAVGAGAAAVGAATKAWADYNAELAKQQQITTVTTGLKGDDADRMTSATRALVRTYNVDFRETINAANVLITQFGKSGDESIQLLREGMQGMIQGDGPKLLNMIQQFAPAFRDAGISADQLVAVIHNSEGGLFSEQNMNAILMGIKNIRNMTSQTAKDLALLGINGDEMSQKMSDGSMTVFEALQQVAVALENANAGSKEAGRVMQDVFGRQGAMQGMKLGRAIAELNTNLEETKRQTGEIGKAYDQLYESSVKLEQALQKTFGYERFDVLATKIKTELVETLVFTVDTIGNVKNAIDNVYSALDNIGENNAFAKVAATAIEFIGPLGKIHLLLKAIGVDEDTNTEKTEGLFERYKKAYDKLHSMANGNHHLYTETVDSQGNILKATSDGKDVTEKVIKANKQNTTTPIIPPKTTNIQNVETEKEISIQQQIAALEKEAFTASEERRKEIAVTIHELDKELTRQQQIRDALHGKVEESKELAAAEKQYADAVAKVASWQRSSQSGISSYISESQKSLNAATLGSADYTRLYANIVDATAYKNLMQVAIQQGLDEVVIDSSPLWQQIINMEDIPNSTWSDIVSTINQKLKDAGIDKVIGIDLKTGKTSEGKNQTTAAKSNETVIGLTQKMSGGISSIVNGIEGLGVELPKGMTDILGGIQTVTTILTGISALVSAIEIITTADAAIPFFAQGGVVKAANGFSGLVPGTHLSGDLTPALLNAGETVLTAAQAGNLNTMLQDESRGVQNAQSYVEGEKIWLGVNNFLRRSGRGEIVTSRR